MINYFKAKIMNKDNTKEKENEIRRILDGQKRGLTENQLTNKINRQTTTNVSKVRRTQE